MVDGPDELHRRHHLEVLPPRTRSWLDDLVAFQHEVPFAYPANVELPWAESYDLNLNSGSRLTTVKQLIPDIDGAIQSILYSLFYRTSRSVTVDNNGNVIPVVEQQTPPRQVRPNGYVDFRITGRDVRLRIEIGCPARPAAARCSARHGGPASD